MPLIPRVDLRQSQTLVMTPQLQQAIKLLQMSNLELDAYVDQELERNPLLTRDDPGEEGTETPDPPEAAEGRAAVDAVAADDSLLGVAESRHAMDVDVDNQFGDIGADAAGAAAAFDSWGGGGASDFSDPSGDLERVLADRPTLRDRLIAQISLDIADPGDRLIALGMLDHLDECGYLAADLADLAARLGCPVARAEAVLDRLQRLDPAGLFARDLAECLALQLRERDRLDPAMRALLDNLEMLGRRDTQALLAACGVDAEDLAGMVAEIRALDPKPALAFGGDAAPPVTPDILMRPGPDGGWIVELNPDTLPRVLVNNTYHARILVQTDDRATRRYLSESLHAANWLVKALHQRATTILKVATEIVRQQNGFFAHGVGELRPLILRDIAEAIEMHESTVSRVTSNKFIATPRGLFELKYFFTTAIAAADGGSSHSSEAVRHRIKALIESEEPRRVLSDDKIVELLRKEGIDIARRTVAKYREGMRIPSSVHRRRDKRLILGGN